MYRNILAVNWTHRKHSAASYLQVCTRVLCFISAVTCPTILKQNGYFIITFFSNSEELFPAPLLLTELIYDYIPVASFADKPCGKPIFTFYVIPEMYPAGSRLGSRGPAVSHRKRKERVQVQPQPSSPP